MRSEPTPDMPLVPGARYWLHVHSDGTELRCAAEPTDRLTLTVDVVEVHAEYVVEQTYTRTVRQMRDANHDLVRCGPFLATPRGEGWMHHDGRSDNFTVWRRRRKVSGAGASGGAVVIPLHSRRHA
jgi:hypothetical protein